MAPPPPPRDALEGKGPQRRFQKRLERRLEEVAKAATGGYCRFQMPLKLALAVREAVAGPDWTTSPLLMHPPPPPPNRRQSRLVGLRRREAGAVPDNRFDMRRRVSQTVVCCIGFVPGNPFQMGKAAHEVDNLGTQALVDAAVAAGVKRFVLVSSILTNGRAIGTLFRRAVAVRVPL